MDGLLTTEGGANGVPAQPEQNGVDDGLPPVPPIKEIKICGICHLQASKYRCAKCKKPYCSVECATLHKDDHPPEPESKPEPVVPKVAIPLPLSSAPGTFGGAKTSNPFTVLDKSPELQTLFAKYPRLRSQLRDLHAFTMPPSENGMSMNQYAIETQNQYGHNPSSNFRGRGGRGGTNGARHQRPEHTGPWNVDQGMQNAIDALSRAKEESGKGGEGVREYVRLVSKLVSSVGDEVVKVVQDEVAAENARLIQELLDRESY